MPRSISLNRTRPMLEVVGKQVDQEQRQSTGRVN